MVIDQFLEVCRCHLLPPDSLEIPRPTWDLPCTYNVRTTPMAETSHDRLCCTLQRSTPRPAWRSLGDDSFRLDKTDFLATRIQSWSTLIPLDGTLSPGDMGGSPPEYRSVPCLFLSLVQQIPSNRPRPGWRDAGLVGCNLGQCTFLRKTFSLVDLRRHLYVERTRTVEQGSTADNANTQAFVLAQAPGQLAGLRRPS